MGMLMWSELLKTKTVDPNINVLDAHGDGGTPWFLAAKRGHISVLEVLLEASADHDAVELPMERLPFKLPQQKDNNQQFDGC